MSIELARIELVPGHWLTAYRTLVVEYQQVDHTMPLELVRSYPIPEPFQNYDFRARFLALLAEALR